MNVSDKVAPPKATSHQIQFSLLRLTDWPDIPHLPTHDMVDMARICALLSWRATAGVIIPRILGIPKERVQEILQLLHAQGCLNIHAQQPMGQAESPPVVADEGGTPEEVGEAPANSLITKIWQRLAARH